MTENPAQVAAKKPAEIRLHLSLRSATLSPEELSEQVGTSFDQCHRIGEPRARTALNEEWWQQNKRYWDDHWWILHETVQSTYGTAYDDLPKAIARLLSRVEPRGQDFANLAVGELAELSICIYCDGYPGMGLGGELLQRIARLDLCLNFDLYCEPECKRVHLD